MIEKKMQRGLHEEADETISDETLVEAPLAEVRPAEARFAEGSPAEEPLAEAPSVDETLAEGSSVLASTRAGGEEAQARGEQEQSGVEGVLSSWLGALPRVMVPLYAIIVGAGLGEAYVVHTAVTSSGASFGMGVFGGFSSLMLMLFFFLPLAFGAAALFSTPSNRNLGEAIKRGLGGGNLSCAALGGMALCGIAGGAGVIVGKALAARMSPRFALVGTILVVLVVAIGTLPVVNSLTSPLGRLFERWSGNRVIRALTHPSALLLVLAAGAFFALPKVLPTEYRVAPAAGLFLWGLMLLPALSRRWQLFVVGARALMLAAGLWLVAGVSPWLAEVASPAAQEAILYRAPYLGLTIAISHRFLDKDRDGYAEYLLGGDCDGNDPAINPQAQEIAGNGIDENCSGADAEIYIPPEEPSYARPVALPEHNNIVLIQIEALRPDRLSSNGYHRPTTPLLDAFRAESTYFARSYTPAPSTRFAMPSLFIGQDPTMLPQKGSKGNSFRLLPKAETVPELLRAEGYDTYGLTISYVMHHNKGTGQGFRVWKTPWPVDDWEKVMGKAAPITTDDALNYLKKRRTGSPNYLLFTHYRCTHDPYIKHKEWDWGDEDSDRYDSALRYCDTHVGRLLDGLRAQEDYDSTAVIIFSDHGELFGEHGLTNHGNSLFEDDVRTILMMKIPGAAPSEVDIPVRLTDVAPTMRDLASVDRAKDLDGWSLLPLIFGEADHEAWMARPLHLFTDIVRGAVKFRAAAVVLWPYKVIRNRETNRRMLFNVADDPDEGNDLSASDPDRLAEMDALIESWLARVPPK